MRFALDKHLYPAQTSQIEQSINILNERLTGLAKMLQEEKEKLQGLDFNEIEFIQSPFSDHAKLTQ